MLRVRVSTLTAACFSLVLPVVLNCTGSGGDTESSEAAIGEVEYVDCQAIAGVPGKLPKDDRLSPMQQVGRCTWVLSTGRTTTNPDYQVDYAGNHVAVPEGQGGTENMFRDIARKNGTVVPILEILAAKSEADREARWRKYGTINDPGCKAASGPDEYGLELDDCVDKYSTGIVGARKFDNPAFDGSARARWMGLKAQGMNVLMQAYRTDPTLEAPYLVGNTCGVCHTAFDPASPPADPAHPKWSNLKFTLGNQYLREGELFKAATNGPSDFRWHVLDSQEPGTSDTSRIASDHINNPNAINPIYSLLSRPWHDEKLKQGQVTFDLTANVCPDLSTTCAEGAKIPVAAALALLKPEQASKAIAAIRRIATRNGEVHKAQSILKGGEDSVGPIGALLRVYVNIGLCSKTWTKHFDPVNGMGMQTPLGQDELSEECAAYNQMLARAPALTLFLASQGPIYLKDVPGGAQHVNDSAAEQGKLVFAENCASCHSSKQPPAGTTDKKAWFRDAIQQDDWLLGNFLSDDLAHPVTEIGTNIGRASHTNHMKGHIWNDAYASQSYDERQWPGDVTIENPYGSPFKYRGPNGGPGYYRTPTLISLWTRAPFMHNRALGEVDAATNKMAVPGPSVDQRVAAFEAAARMLLSPEQRPRTVINGVRMGGLVKTTSDDSVLSFQKFGLDFQLHIPKGTPVNLIANLDPNLLDVQAEFGQLAIKDAFWSQFNPNGMTPGDLLYGNSGTHLLHLSESPDLVENKGHVFGKDLSPTDKSALVEYLKTL